jgi:hypothetical protein
VELTFDKNRRIMNEDVTGGELASEEEYLAANPEADA